MIIAVPQGLALDQARASSSSAHCHLDCDSNNRCIASRWKSVQSQTVSLYNLRQAHLHTLSLAGIDNTTSMSFSPMSQDYSHATICLFKTLFFSLSPHPNSYSCRWKCWF